MEAFQKVGNLIKHSFATFGAAYCVGHCVGKYVDIVFTTGESMEPLVPDGGVYLLERNSIRRHEVTEGDVVVSKSPESPTEFVCKQVTGLEGSVMPCSRPEGATYKYVPRGYVWLEGVNKGCSNDSRHYGPVPIGLLKGRIFFQLYPHFGFFNPSNETSR